MHGLRRFVLAALAAVLVGVSAVTGCGSNATEEAEGSLPAVTSEPVSEATAPSEPSSDDAVEPHWESLLDVAVTGDGSVYASAPVGIALLDEGAGAWAIVNIDGLPEGTPTDESVFRGRSVEHIAAGPDGALWAAGSAVSSADDDEFGVLADDEWADEAYRALTWVARGTCDGAQCTWEVFTSVDTAALDPWPTDIGDIAIGADGTLFAAMGDDQLVTYDGTAWESATVRGLGGVHPWSSSLAVDRQGVLWAGTNAPGAGRGLLTFDDDEITRLTTADGLPSDGVFQVSAGDDGSIWVATDAVYDPTTASPEQAAGVAHGEGTTWTNYTLTDGLLSDDGVVAAGPDGTAWVVHNEIPPFGFAHFDGTAWTAYPTAEPLGGFRAVVDADGTLWSIGDSAGLVRFDGTTTTVYPSPFQAG